MPNARCRRRRSERQQERLEARALHGRGHRDAAHDRRIDAAGPRAGRNDLSCWRIACQPKARSRSNSHRPRKVHFSARGKKATPSATTPERASHQPGGVALASRPCRSPRSAPSWPSHSSSRSPSAISPVTATGCGFEVNRMLKAWLRRSRGYIVALGRYKAVTRRRRPRYR